MKVKLTLTDSEGAKSMCETESEDSSAAGRGFVFLAKALGILVATAIGGLIPLLHFIVIPVGLVIFVYFLITGLKNGQKFEDVQAECPHCKGIFLIFRKPLAALPFRQLCDRCQQVITVERQLV